MDNLTYYLEILKLEPENISALKGLAEIYRAGGQWDKLIEVYEKLFSLSEEEDDRISYILEVANTYYQQLNDIDKAVEFYLDALELQPQDQNSITPLIRLFEKTDKLPQLNIMLQGQCFLIKDAAQVDGLTGKIIDNFASLEMYDEAFAMLSAAKEPPGEAVKKLYDRIKEKGLFSKIIEYRDVFIRTFKSPDELSNLYTAIADVYYGAIGDIYEAACNYEMALASNANNRHQIISRLNQIYSTLDEPILLLPILFIMKDGASQEERYTIDRNIGLCYMKLEDPSSALPFLKTASASKPDDKELLYIMLDVYTTLGATEDAYTTIRKLLEIENEDERKIPLYKKAIPVFIDKKDYETAKQLIKTLVEITGDQANYKLLKQIYAETGDYDELVTFYLERLNGKEDEKGSAPLWAALGDVYFKGFSHYEYSIDSYCRALALDPGNTLYMETLITLYSSAERWQEAEQTILQLLPATENGEKRHALQLKLGELYLTNLKDYDRAAALYNDILVKYPDDEAPLTALERIYRENNNYAELVTILEKKLGTAEKKHDLLIELGSILFDRGIDLKKAQEYLWQALELNPASTYGIDVIKRLYETTGDYTGFEKLYSFLIDRVNPSDKTKVELLVKLGHIRYEKLAMPDKAVSTFEQVLSIDPYNNEANLSLANLYFKADMWEKAEPHFGFVISHNIVDQQHLPEFLFEYARILDKLGKQENALHYYKKAFELNSAEKKYAEAYGHCAFANHNHEAAIAAFEAMIKLSKPDDNLNEIYKKLTSSYEASGDYRSASMYLMKLNEKEPSSLELIQWLEKLAMNGKDYSLLSSTLKKEAELSETDEQKIRIILKRAEILEENLNEPQSALKTIEELAESRKKNLDVYLKLGSLYKKLNRTKELISTIQETLKFPISGEQKVNLLLEMAALHKDDVQKAITIYRDILAIQPDNNAAFSSLSGAYEALNDYKALSALYEDRLSDTESLEDMINMQKKLASIKTEKLNDLDGGISIYQGILKLKPSDSSIYPVLESLLIKKGDPPSLNRLYESAAANAVQKDIKFDYFMKSAELLLNQLKDEKGAIRSYESAFSIDKTNNDALIKLAKLTASQQMYDKAMNYYREAVKLNTVPDETRADLNFEYAKLLKDKGNTNEAYQAYKEAYTISPSNIDYRLSYGESAYAVGLYKDAYDALKNIAYAHEQELLPEQLFPLYKILSDISRRLGNLQQAVEYLLRAVDINNKDIQGLTTLDELTSTMGNYELEIDVLTKLSKALDKPLERAQILVKIAKLKHDKLYDLGGATPLLREAMAIMPDNIQIYNELVQIYREQSDVDNEIEILGKVLKIEKSSDNYVSTAMRLAEIYIEFKNDLDTARKYCLEALKKEPSSIPALKGLGRIFELQGDFTGMAELYQRFVKVLLPKEPKKVLPLIKELGGLYAKKLNNAELAIQQYQTIVNVEPSDVDAHLLLAELLSRNKSRTADAVREYGIVLKYMSDNIPAIRFLSKFYEQKKEYDRVFLYYSVLKLLGQEKDLERIFVDANRNKQPRQPKLPLTDDLFHTHFLHMKTRGPLKDIMNVFSDYGQTIFKPDLKSFGIGKQERITTKSTVWQEYGRLLQLLGIKDIDIYQTAKGNFKIVIENTDPPSLIVNTSSMSGLSAEEKAFILAEHLSYIKSGFVLPMKLGKQRFSQLINSLVKIFSPGTATPQDREPNLQTITNAVNGSLSKKQRTALDEPVKKYLKVASNYIDEWFLGIEMTGARTGTFIIGDIEPVFSSLVKWHIGDTSLLSNKEKRKDIFLSSELMQDMLQFYLSDSHFLLRSKLGMSILSV